MLGKDGDKNEYWFFKEDSGKLFIKKFEESKENLIMLDEEELMRDDDYLPKEIMYQWFFYDEEDEFDKLVDACNVKGIRERKL